MRRKGFTLVELLVVIAIIGLLAGLLFPVISKVQGQAKIRQCQANLKEMGVALNLYYSIFQEYPKKSWGGAYKVAHLVACKRVGFSPKQCICPVNSNGETMDNGNTFITTTDYTTESAPGGYAAAAPPGTWTDHLNYGSRKKNYAIPTDAVDSASTPLAAGDQHCVNGHGNILNVVFLDGHVDQIAETNTTWNDATNAKGIALDLLDNDSTN